MEACAIIPFARADAGPDANRAPIGKARQEEECNDEPSAMASSRTPGERFRRFSRKGPDGQERRTVKQFLISLTTTVVFLAILVGSAGHLDYWQAWVYAAMSTVMNLCTRFILRNAPDVAKERAKPGRGAKGWDKALLGLGFLLNLVTLVVAGLDSGRLHWRPQLPWGWSIAGIALSTTGMFIFLLALRENRFFSAVVRVQTDRGHTVCDTGPYSVVRHPGNAAMIIGTIGLPLVFTSAWSGIPALLSSVLLVARTRLEDVALERELLGYRDYQRSVHFRLVPGLW
jgi:protein-S-isoprenylcysteine O-methyltransferase Ste14